MSSESDNNTEHYGMDDLIFLFVIRAFSMKIPGFLLTSTFLILFSSFIYWNLPFLIQNVNKMNPIRFGYAEYV